MDRYTWDIAGAAVELELSGQELDQLCAMVEAECGRTVDPVLLALMTPCYLALQLGDRVMAAEIVAEWPAEVHRLGPQQSGMQGGSSARS